MLYCKHGQPHHDNYTYTSMTGVTVAACRCCGAILFGPQAEVTNPTGEVPEIYCPHCEERPLGVSVGEIQTMKEAL